MKAANATILIALLFTAVTTSSTEVQAQSLATDSCAALTGDPFWLQRDVPNSVKFQKMDAERAIAQCRQELAADPDNVELRFYLGRALLKNKNYDESVPLLSEAAEAGIASADLSLGIYKHRGDIPSASETETDRHYERASKAGHSLADHWFVERKRKNDRDGEITKAEIESIHAAAKAGYPYSWRLLFKLTIRDVSGEESISYLQNGHELGDISATTMLADFRFLEMTGGNVFGDHDRGLVYLAIFTSFGTTQIGDVVSLYEEVLERTSSDRRRQRVTKRLVFIYLFAAHTDSGNDPRAAELYCNRLSDADKSGFKRWESYIQLPYCGEDT